MAVEWTLHSKKAPPVEQDYETTVNQWQSTKFVNS